ncbi:MAG: zinc-dependent metalloprotease [Actinomycetota bacterium]
MSQDFGGMPDDAFADVPLLREIQRVLLSGSGPVNWELARQIGIASGALAREDHPASEEDRRGLEGAVRMAELAVADLTGMDVPPEVRDVRAVRRAEWVESNVRGLRGLFEPGAERLARALAEARRAEGEDPDGSPQLLEAVMERMAPLLTGVQVGMVLGHLAQRVLGQYELPLPRAEQPALLFVVPNIAEFERDWSLPPDQFRAWVALHETTHSFALGRPWVRDHFMGLVREMAAAMEFDLTGLQERLEGLDLSDPESLTEALGGELLTGALTDEQRLLLRRVQAFLAVAEGHAGHVMDRIGAKILPEYARIGEAMKRRHEERSQEEQAVERLLGIEMKIEQYRLGRAFCNRVAEQTDERTLSKIWDSPESLPSMPELEEPTLWLSRMA